MARDRALAVLFALALHAALLSFALRSAPRPPAPPPPAVLPPLHLWPLALASTKTPPSRHAPPHAVVAQLVAEREIIDQGHGVTMTIEGGGGPWFDPEVIAPQPALHPSERWLSVQVVVPAGPSRAPRPSEFCAPKEPEMPEIAVERSITGRVDVTYIVDADGVVSGVAQEGDAPLVLSRAVRGWLSGCLFDPAIESGRRVPARVRQTFVFKIR